MFQGLPMAPWGGPAILALRLPDTATLITNLDKKWPVVRLVSTGVKF